MSDKHRHPKGARVAGESAGGRFAPVLHTSPNLSSLEFSSRFASRLRPGDLIDARNLVEPEVLEQLPHDGLVEVRSCTPHDDGGWLLDLDGVAEPVLVPAHVPVQSVHHSWYAAPQLRAGDVIVLDRGEQLVEHGEQLVEHGEQLVVEGYGREVEPGVFEVPTDNGTITLREGERVDVSDPFSALSKDGWDQDEIPVSEAAEDVFLASQLGLETLGGVSSVTVTHDDDGRSSMTVSLYESPVEAGALTQEQYDTGFAYLADFLGERYGLEVIREEDGELELHAHAELGAPTHVSPSMLSEVAWERTSIVRFHNEVDRGTYGSPYVYSEIAESIDTGFFASRTEMVAHTGQLTDIWDASRAGAELLSAHPDLFTKEEQELVLTLMRRGYTIDKNKMLELAERLRAELTDSHELGVLADLVHAIEHENEQ